MRLLILGSTGYHPNERRHTACLMLPEVGVVLDAGTAMFRVRRHLVTPQLRIFLSHAHLDHVFGLTFLFDVLADTPVNRAEVYGEPDKLAAIREHLFSELLFPVEPPCRFIPLAGPVPLPGGGELGYFPLEHPGGSIGFRLQWPDRSMAYITDTVASAGAAYVEHIRGVDLLVHECYFSDEQAAMAQKTGHSHVTPVAQVAAKAGVGRLLLVHLDPTSNELDPVGLHAARRVFPATDVGVDDLALDF